MFILIFEIPNINYKIMKTHTITFGGNPLTLEGTHLQTGDKAPQFKVSDGSLQEVTVSCSDGKVTILSIFPSIDTPVCAIQTKRFNKEATALSEKVEIVAISADLPFAQQRFCAAEGIDRINVYSDYRGLDFGTKYGFLIKELKLLARGVVVIDSKGVIRHIEYVSELGHEPDYDAALKAVKALL